jgi:hypothetical protein
MKGFTALLAALLIGCYSLYAEDLIEISQDAYIYGYPLVVMDATEEAITSAKAPVNQFLHLKEFPEADFEAATSPNADTLYSSAWLDVSKEPILLSVPEIKDRYYILQFLDAWTNVIGSISPRTVGSSEGSFAIVGPNWKGTLPKNIEGLKCPTNTVWLIGRIKTDKKEEYPLVNALQDQLQLRPLSYWGKSYQPKPDNSNKQKIDFHDSPAEHVNQMDAIAFYSKMNQLLKEDPPPERDRPIFKKLEKIGVLPDQNFKAKSFSQKQLEELNQGLKNARAKIKAEWRDPKTSKVNGWNIFRKNIGDFGTDYLLRATIAYGAIGANLANDAIYAMTRFDRDEIPLNASYPYYIHFKKEELPPTNAFWSLTLYNDLQFFVPNLLHRYNLSSSDALKYNEDGSLDIYIQIKSPGKEKLSNWLPAPNGDFNLILRIYQPKAEALNGKWNPSTVNREH